MPQINLGCYVSQDRGLPVFYVTYIGSIVDKACFPKMMELNDDLGISEVRGFIMDRGFCSTANIKYLAKSKYDFIIEVEKRHKTAKMALDKARPEMFKLANRIDSGLYSLSMKGVFYGTAATMHIYFAQELSTSQMDALRRVVEEMENRLAQKSAGSMNFRNLKAQLFFMHS